MNDLSFTEQIVCKFDDRQSRHSRVDKYVVQVEWSETCSSPLEFQSQPCRILKNFTYKNGKDDLKSKCDSTAVE